MSNHSHLTTVDDRLFWRYCLAIAAFFVVMLALGSTGYIFLGIAAIAWGTKSPLAAIQSMFFIILFSSMNTGVYCFDIVRSADSSLSIIRYVAIFAFFCTSIARELLKKNFYLDISMKMLFLFLIIVIVTSPIVSYAVDVSIFKIAIFTVGIFTLFLTARQANEYYPRESTTWLQATFISLPWLSAPLLAVPLGYSCNLAGFQGWVGQPQAFSVIMALVVSWLTAQLFYSKSHHFLYATTLMVGAVELFLSGSRTGVGAVVISIVLFTAMGLNRRPRRIGLMILGMSSIVGIALLTPAGRDVAISFVRKRDAASEFQSISDQAVETRAALAERSWNNFVDHPVFGMGFGTASEEYALVIQRDPILGLPVSAPAEKGVFWIAALEEIGVIGTAVMLALFSVIVVQIYRSGNREWLAIVVCALVLNFGESMLFSLGGIGALLWLLISLGAYSRRTAQ
jgi:O-antigen ligase